MKALWLVLAVLIGVSSVAAAEVTMRERLLGIAAEARVLERSARAITNSNPWYGDRFHRLGGEETTNVHFHPLQNDLLRYSAGRPWLWRYDCRFHNEAVRLVTNAPAWPVSGIRAKLLPLLKDPSADVRCVAVEALGACLEPDDVPAIAALLDDDAGGPPALRWNSLESSVEPEMPDRVLGWKEWQQRRVRDYAGVAVRLMTGQSLTRETFPSWWRTNDHGRMRIWYWQARLHCELGEVEALSNRRPWPKLGENMEAFILARQRQQAARNAKVIEQAERELREQSPEVEAKVKLLAVNNFSSGLGMELDDPLMGRFTSTRLSRERLFELLERKNLWPEVNWVRWGEGNDSVWISMAGQIAFSADRFFRREDIPRLRSIAVVPAIKRPMSIGISRLLPPATFETLNDSNTADGVLRAAIHVDDDKYRRRDLVAELARIGWDRNKEFLEAEFFTNLRRDDYAVRQTIVEALTTAPLTTEKRRFLGRLLLDERYTLLWVRTKEHPGSDIDGGIATQAVNAYGNSEQRQTVQMAFINRESTPDALKRARAIMEQLFKQDRSQ
jgi:hypothetical protein